MRVGVFDGHAPVGGPAGMGDSKAKFRRGVALVGDFFGQGRNLAYGFEGFHAVRRVSYGDSCGIVSPVFQPFETVEEHGVGVFAVTSVGEDSAHGV